LLCR
jgi:conserved hypothetical protein YmdA/YtgF